MKNNYNSNYLGLVINNDDPEFRGRIQVFVPHIMPTLYEGWNKDGDNITINCVGDNMPQGLTSEIIDKLKSILPWAEAASPIVGQCSPGSVLPSSSSAATVGSASASAGAPTNTLTSTSADTANNPGGAVFDQSPTAAPAGQLPPGGSCIIPTESGTVDMKNLVPGFAQRLNGFFNEATSLNYKIVCSSGFRSPEKQRKLYEASGGNGSVAKPGNSAHEYGIAVDLKVSGNGVTIQTISAAQDRSANKDTPAFRALLAKYGLHQPLHPDNGGSIAEKWHIEPTETNKAGGSRGQGPFTSVAQKLGATTSSIEAPSSSQLPPAGNPLETKSPASTDSVTSLSPTTNQIPKAPAISAGGQGISGTISGGGTVSESIQGTAKLAADRTARFEPELSDPMLLDRIEFVIEKEGGAQGKLIFETAVNRAFFGNRSLKTVMFEKAYFKDAAKGDPNATKTKPHTSLTLNAIKEVIYNGANVTNLATDQAYNDANLFAKKFINAGATGDWFNLRNGQKITDPAKITSLTNSKGSGMEEFIYRKDGTGDARSTAGLKAKEYALKYNVQPTSPSAFNSDTPLPPELAQASKSELTEKPLNTTQSPVTVSNIDQHGPTVVKNTNDAAKGLFAFPGVGAMVWVFFREGNPLFPVYFAASYSSSEWKSAYNASGINPEGTNNGTAGSQMSNSMHLTPNAGGGLEFTHVKDTSDPTGKRDKAVAMIYGDDGSNMLFSKGYHQIYTRHDRRDQIDGNLYSIIGGAEERWVEDDSSVNVRGNVVIKIGKVDKESLEAMKELADFSKQMNDTLMSNSQ